MLGLSATPERIYDEIGTEFILDHIGSTIFEFGLEDAIMRRILVPFNYFPLRYELTEGDRQELQRIHRLKAARDKSENPMPDEEYWMAIARVYKTSEGKIPVFQEYVRENPEILERCIIFVETKQYGEEILDIIHKYRKDFHTYFDSDDSSVLEMFSTGTIECLLTCHRISEGIDIQSLKNVILISSSRALLETIQRIGRCLRSDPNDLEKVAIVVDFIRSSEQENTDETNADIDRMNFLQALSEIKPEN
jgi:superfamily II DNA or RNA helicase